jgi:hypothetical protein
MPASGQIWGKTAGFDAKCNEWVHRALRIAAAARWQFPEASNLILWLKI